MDRLYKITYINWKDLEKEAYIVAENKNEAIKTSEIMQGLKRLLSVKEC